MSTSVRPARRTLAASGYLQPLPTVEQPAAEKYHARWLVALVALGLAARAIRYFLKFPLWEDECFLSVNLIDRGYRALLDPLDFHQVAPPLFLWTQKALIQLLGFHEWSLRLVAFVASVTSLGLFVILARRLLTGLPLLLAVGMFAVSYPGIRYAAEAKPYGSDLCVALVLLVLAVEAWQRVDARWLWALAVVTPLAIGFSYPAIFVAGGVSLALAPTLWKRRSTSAWLAWSVFNGLIVASFAILYLTTARTQATAELDFMSDYWQNTFPPLDNLFSLVGWLVQVHTGMFLAIPVGGERGASVVTAACVAVGLIALARGRRRTMILLCLAPLGLNLIAAALHRYPYGGHPKFSQYAAPAICLLGGIGAAAMLTHFRQRWRWCSSNVTVALATLALIGAGSIVRDVAHPYKTASDARARAFAQWFWHDMPQTCELACLKTDFDVDFSPDTWSELNWSAMYLCNQRIYSPRHQRGEPLRLELVGRERPLCCVEYRAVDRNFDQAAFKRWLDGMRDRYELVCQQTYPVPRFDKHERVLVVCDAMHVYQFVPKAALARATAPRERSDDHRE